MWNNSKVNADLAVAIAFLLLLAIVAYGSIAMERPDGWLTSPGLFPLVTVCICSIFFSVIAIKAVCNRNSDAHSQPMRSPPIQFSFLRAPVENDLLNLIIAIAIYYFVLLSILPFEISTLVFVAYIQLRGASQNFWPGLLLLSAVITITISIAFRGMFGVLLPGKFDLLGALLLQLGQ